MGVTEKTLLERGAETASIEAALTQSFAGSGLVLMIEGPAGIGKSALLDLARDRAEREGALVLTARGGPVERELPFGVTRELFEPVIGLETNAGRRELLAGGARHAALVLGSQGEGPGDPLAPIQGLFWLVVRLAQDRPAVLIVDDAHWADVQTLRFLHYLARRVQDVPVLAVLGVRTGEADEPREIEAMRLESKLAHPQPLTAAAIGEIVRDVLGDRANPGLVNACTEVTAGNPFLLREVLRTAEQEAHGDDIAGAIRKLGPESVARYALVRLARFGDDAVALAKSIAILGGSPQLRQAAALAALEPDAAARICDRLREAEVLAPGRPIQFVHPLVRMAIYREHSEEECSAAHRRAAEVLADAGSSAREVAPHLLACAPNGDPWVVAKLGEATWDAVASGAFDSARSYLERALREPPEDDVPLLHALGRCMLPTDAVAAAEVMLDAAEKAQDRTKVRLLRDAGLARFLAGDFPGATDCYEAVLNNLGDHEDEQRLIITAIHHLTAATGRGADPERTRTLERVVARTDSSTPGGSHIRQALAVDLCVQCARVGRVVDLASSFTDEVWDFRTPIPTAACRLLVWCGRWDESAERFGHYLGQADGLGSTIGVGYLSSLLAEALRAAGRLQESEARARLAVEIASASPATQTNPDREGKVNLISTLLAAGDLEAAAEVAETTDLSRGALDQFTGYPWPLEARGLLRLAQGDLEGAVDDLLLLGEGLENLGFLNPAISPWRQEAAPALTALERTGEARDLVEVAEERARSFGAAHSIGIVLRARAMTEPRQRQIRTLEESAICLEESGPPHELARTLVELGAALRRDGRRSDSREPLRRALELAHLAGARGTEARAREELAAAGSRPRSVFRTGVDSLTASELRSARLAAAGLSNLEIAQRLFITRKTVEKHLSNSYTKLEISSREELADALGEPSAAS